MATGSAKAEAIAYDIWLFDNRGLHYEENVSVKG